MRRIRLRESGDSAAGTLHGIDFLILDQRESGGPKLLLEKWSGETYETRSVQETTLPDNRDIADAFNCLINGLLYSTSHCLLLVVKLDHAELGVYPGSATRSPFAVMNGSDEGHCFVRNAVGALANVVWKSDDMSVTGPMEIPFVTLGTGLAQVLGVPDGQTVTLQFKRFGETGPALSISICGSRLQYLAGNEEGFQVARILASRLP